MGPFQNAIPSAVRPVTVVEFANALLKRWVPQARGRSTLGLPPTLWMLSPELCSNN
jgi:hypothetical protein